MLPQATILQVNQAAMSGDRTLLDYDFCAVLPFEALHVEQVNKNWQKTSRQAI